ncbi:MAG: MBL fold metallo-hydrolase [Candidatus Hadarchaeales archaeon]
MNPKQEIPDYYGRLGVPQNASQEEIEAAFVLSVKSIIPELQGDAGEILRLTEDLEGLREGWGERKALRIEMLREAYLVLSDAKRRGRYDAEVGRLREAFFREIRSGSFRLVSLGETIPGGCICLFARVGERYVIFDAGLNQRTGSIPPYHLLRRFPKVSAVFLSHAHADHMGSLPFLLRRLGSVPVFATRETISTAEKVFQDALKQLRKETGTSPISQAELSRVLASITPVEYGKEYEVGGLSFLATDAGHVPGSAMFLVKCGGDSVAYTGDFNVERTRTQLPARPFTEKPGLLICEATYVREQERVERGKREEELVGRILETVEEGGRVLIPCYAIGRTREVVEIIDSAVEEGELPEVPVYAVGLGPALERSWRWKHVKRVEGDWFSLWKKARPPFVMIAGSGTLDRGSSSQLLPDLVWNPRDAIVGVGHIPSGSTFALLKRAKAGERVVLDREFKPECKIYEVQLSAHAPMEGIIEFIVKQNPERLAVVHSEMPEGILNDRRVRAAGIRAVAVPRLQVVREDLSLGPILLPQEFGSKSPPCECECGKVFSNLKFARWHEAREGHRLRGVRRVVFVKCLGEEVEPGRLAQLILERRKEFVRRCAKLCASMLGEARRPTREEVRASMMGVAEGMEGGRAPRLVCPSCRREVEGEVCPCGHPLFLPREENLVGIFSNEVQISVHPREEFVEISGVFDDSFLRFLERPWRIGNVRVRLRAVESERPETVASPVNLPLYVSSEMSGVAKLLGKRVGAPKFRYALLEPGTLGKYVKGTVLLSPLLKEDPELLATVLDHELAHHFQLSLNGRLRREVGREGVEGQIEFLEGFAQWVTSKLKNSRMLVEVSEREEGRYFTGARLYEDIEAAFGAEGVVEVALRGNQRVLSERAEEARKSLAGLEGMEVLLESGMWRKGLFGRLKLAGEAREFLPELIRQGAREIHRTRYRGWKPEIVAQEAVLDLLAQEAVRCAGFGDPLLVKKAWQYLLERTEEGRELLEELAEVYMEECW